MAKLRYKNNIFLAEWFKTTDSRISSMEPREISSSLKAYAKFGGGNPDFVTKMINIIYHSDSKNKQYIIDGIYSLAMLKDNHGFSAALIDPVINFLAQKIPQGTKIKNEDKHVLLVAYQALEPENRADFKFSNEISAFKDLAKSSSVTKSRAQLRVFGNIRVDSRGRERHPGARMEEYIDRVGARVDILIPGVNMVVQVDGPTHYF